MKNDLLNAFGTPQATLAISGTVAFNSPAMDCRNISNVSLTATWTGTPTGAIKLQASNDKVTWVDIASATVALAGGVGSGRIPVVDLPEQYLRAVCTLSSGSGALFAQLNGKGV